jgi:hypothetical protein
VLIPLLASVVLHLRAADTLKVFDTHLHVLDSVAMRAMFGADEVARVVGAVVLGTPRQLGAFRDPEGVAIIRAMTFPCEEGRMPNSGIQCFADGSVWPDTSMVRRAMESGEISALGEINAQYLGIAIDDARLEPYFALAERFDIPVLIHLGIGPPGVSYADSRFPPRKSPGYSGVAGSPLSLEPVLRKHPRLRVLISHLAWPFIEDLTYLMYMHPGVHADMSVLQYAIPRPALHRALQALVDAGFSSRLMFGSDGDRRRLNQGVLAIVEAPYLTQEQRAAMLFDNADRFFRTSSPP